LDLTLEQKDVAKILQVTKCTIWNWENNRSEPVVQHYPAIMHFLGYCPYQYPKKWGERLRLHRMHQGLSTKKLARLIKVDPGSIQSWEKRGHPPCKYLQLKVDNFLALL
jgi:transcriptional regulator with XRE-family HTH domain